MAAFDDIQKREIFHFLFLEELCRISDPTLYVLKGGVNLRFFFKSPRYSEDMDLDVLGGNVGTLKKNGYKILESASFKRSLQSYAIADIELNDPARAKQTETTQRFRLGLKTEAGEWLPTKVEFSRRESERLPFQLEKINPDIARPYQRLAYRCQHYSGQSAAVQKVRALAGRTVTQARDVFDLGILHSGGHVEADRMGLTSEVIAKAKDNLLSIGYEQFSGQVLDFLNDKVRAEYEGTVAWETLKTTVLRAICDEK